MNLLSESHFHPPFLKLMLTSTLRPVYYKHAEIQWSNVT